jgi:hypothetical protein
MFSSVEAQYHPWFLDSVHELINYANQQLEKERWLVVHSHLVVYLVHKGLET